MPFCDVSIQQTLTHSWHRFEGLWSEAKPEQQRAAKQLHLVSVGFSSVSMRTRVFVCVCVCVSVSLRASASASVHACMQLTARIETRSNH